MTTEPNEQETGPEARPFTQPTDTPEVTADDELAPVIGLSERVRAGVMRLVGFLQNIARFLIRVDVDRENQDTFNQLTLSNLQQQQKLIRGLRADLTVLVDAFNRQADIQIAEQRITRDIASRLTFYETHVETMRYQRTRYDEQVARTKAADDARSKLAAPAVVEQLPLISPVGGTIVQPFNPHGVKADVTIDASQPD